MKLKEGMLLITHNGTVIIVVSRVSEHPTRLYLHTCYGLVNGRVDFIFDNIDGYYTFTQE